MRSPPLYLIHLSRLEKETTTIDTKLPYLNPTKEEYLALYSLSDDTSTIIKDAGKGLG